MPSVRRNRPNVKRRGGASAKAIARLNRSKLRSRRNWAVNETKMVAIAVTTEHLAVVKRQRPLRDYKKVPFACVSTVHRVSSWVIALVQRTGPGPADFCVLNRAVGRYAEFNPGEEILRRLAKDFGLGVLPKKLPRMKAGEISEGL